MRPMNHATERHCLLLNDAAAGEMHDPEKGFPLSASPPSKHRDSRGKRVGCKGSIQARICPAHMSTTFTTCVFFFHHSSLIRRCPRHFCAVVGLVQLKLSCVSCAVSMQ
mmetsp:Transcript_99548/g.167858  ORF Transcript_99548/g.167858 Transcript_99548/m.167858 type:complete len:109 (+) Transcript_99548:263-589(+)